MFLLPSSDDSGIALGASIYAMFNILKQKTYSTEFFASYLGLEYNFSNLTENLSKLGQKYEDEDTILEKLLNLLLNEKVIGICIGRSENGPRALGHRSIICLPNKNSQKIE